MVPDQESRTPYATYHDENGKRHDFYSHTDLMEYIGKNSRFTGTVTVGVQSA